MSRRTAATAARRLIAAGAAVLLSGTATAQQVRAAAVAPGTPVKLMVLKEINSRSSHPGDRFRLRVNEPVLVGGATVVPVGADAWGEITAVDGTSAAGSKGKLAIKLLYVDLPGGPLPITGEQGTAGKANTAGVAFALIGFGLLGLLVKGGNALFKAGDILTGYAAPPPAPAR